MDFIGVTQIIRKRRNIALMLKHAIVLAGFAAGLSAQKTEVAQGYHVVHPEATSATVTSSPQKIEKNGTKKSAMKKHHIKKS